MLDHDDWDWEGEERRPDARQEEARGALRALVEDRRGEVFYARQLQVLLERTYFHWVTHRAMQDLVEEGYLIAEDRPLRFGGTAKILWHSKDRNVRRQIANLVALIEEFSDPLVSESLGWVGEQLVLEAFARNQFLLRGRSTSEFRGATWQRSRHDLDFIFERDGICYGVEVKNKLGYIGDKEFRIKIQMCAHLGIRPLFVCRMLPKIWTKEVVDAGGYAMILEWQLYSLAHRDLARRIKEATGMKCDAPKALSQGTMDRFLRWHEKR